MEEKYSSFRMWLKTRRKLRKIHAETGEPMVEIIDRLAEKELKMLIKIAKEQEDASAEI